MIAEPHIESATTEAVALVQVARLRADLAAADRDLEAARAARDRLDDHDVDLVVRADEAVRMAFRARGIAADRLELALAQLRQGAT